MQKNARHVKAPRRDTSSPQKKLPPKTSRPNSSAPNTSWQKVHDWYDSLVGEHGHYYHQAVILPQALPLLKLKDSSRLLDLGCGQGILSRKILSSMRYVGLDYSQDLIRAAQNYITKKPHHTFIHHDVTKPLPLDAICQKEGKFTHATFILSLQNMSDPASAIKNARQFLEPQGKLLIVMNHPAFRIPRQSSWGLDEATKIQYRKMNGYMSPQKIPIQMHPGKQKTTTEEHNTWSFHYPLSSYSEWLFANGFLIEKIEEWCSDKESTGKASSWENRARKEFPLFLAIVARLT
jgi:ubiquinone/menaquinone biosynthesis C-methylase UbiE